MKHSPRIEGLISRVPDHPISPGIKGAMIDALTIAEKFSARKADMQRSGTLTAKGQEQALRDELTGNTGRSLARAKDQIVKARKDVKARRDKLVVKAIDPADIAAALERQEIRSWLRSLDIQERNTVVNTTADNRVLEAMVTAPAELSGITQLPNPDAIIDAVKARYMEAHYATEIAEIKTIEAVVLEGEAAVAVARNDLKAVVGMDDRSFEAIMLPIERGVGRPWLLKRGENDIQVVEVGGDGRAAYRAATSDDLSHGIYYKDFAEWQQAQAA